MKKSQIVFIAATAAFILILIGMFIGRNTSFSTYLSGKDKISATEKPDGKIDINTATQAQLTLLPGIGDTLANRIIEYRTQNGPFESITDILDVEGIGKGKLEEIQDYIKTGG